MIVLDTSVYFSPSGIKIVRGSFSKKVIIKEMMTVPTARDAMIGGVITNDIALKAALSTVWREKRLPKNNLHIVVDGGAVLMKPMTVPLTGGNDLEAIIRRGFSDTVNHESLLVDYTVDEPALKEGGASVFAYAADRSFIESYVRLFSEIKCRISSINTAQNCCISLMKFTGAANDKTCILACADKNTLLLLLFVNGRYRFSNRVRLFSENGTEEYAGEICSAVSSMIQFSKSQRYGSDIDDIFFCGLGDDRESVFRSASSSFENLRISPLPIPAELISVKGDESGIISPDDYIYCIGDIISENL